MNRFILLICMITSVLFSGSCKKSTTATSIIEGDWELRETQVSITPAKTYAPGNGNKLIFTATTYEAYTNGQLTKSGRYVLVSDTTPGCYMTEAVPVRTRIVYDNDYSSDVDIRLSGDKLSFVSGCFAVDGGSILTYEKLSSQQ